MSHSNRAWYPKKNNTRLLRLTDGYSQNDDFITLGQAVEGFHIFGAIGSGKTSGSGQTLARTFLYNGFGGLVLTVKNDEIETWLGVEGRQEPQYKGHLEAAGRLDDAIIVDINSSYQFNPFLYEMTRPDGLGQRTLNLANLLRDMYLMGLAFKGKSGAGGGESAHWDNIRDECLNRTIDLLKLAEEEITPLNMRKLVSTIPQHKDNVNDFVHRGEESEESEEAELRFNDWLLERRNYCFLCLNKAFQRKTLTTSQEETLEEVYQYFMTEYPEIRTDNEKGSIQSSFKAMIEPFVDPDDILQRFFSQGVSDELRPEACLEGKIIILNFPTDQFGIAANYAQTLYKLVWQRAMMRRNLAHNDRPVFLWIDECSVFVNKNDGDFFSRCRSKKISSVLLNQNLPSYYVTIGGKYPKDETNRLLGNLNTKIFHFNDEPTTNEWAAKVIGRSDQDAFSATSQDEGGKGSASIREQNKYDVPPENFKKLLQGGGKDLIVEAYISSGRTLSNGKKHTKAIFDQTYMSE